MSKQGYIIYTFRGYQRASSFLDAKKIAHAMINGIVDDGWGDSYQWAKIVDFVQRRSRLVHRIGNYRFSLTRWLAGI